MIGWDGDSGADCRAEVWRSVVYKWGSAAWGQGSVGCRGISCPGALLPVTQGVAVRLK